MAGNKGLLSAHLSCFNTKVVPIFDYMYDLFFDAWNLLETFQDMLHDVKSRSNFDNSSESWTSIKFRNVVDCS